MEEERVHVGKKWENAPIPSMEKIGLKMEFMLSGRTSYLT